MDLMVSVCWVPQCVWDWQVNALGHRDMYTPQYTGSDPSVCVCGHSQYTSPQGKILCILLKRPYGYITMRDMIYVASGLSRGTIVMKLFLFCGDKNMNAGC